MGLVRRRATGGCEPSRAGHARWHVLHPYEAPCPALFTMRRDREDHLRLLQVSLGGKDVFGTEKGRPGGCNAGLRVCMGWGGGERDMGSWEGDFKGIWPLTPAVCAHACPGKECAGRGTAAWTERHAQPPRQQWQGQGEPPRGGHAAPRRVAGVVLGLPRIGPLVLRGMSRLRKFQVRGRGAASCLVLEAAVRTALGGAGGAGRRGWDAGVRAGVRSMQAPAMENLCPADAGMQGNDGLQDTGCLMAASVRRGPWQ